MRVIFDNNVPAGVVGFLARHVVATAPELGWERLKNGVLLAECEAAGFDVLVTADQNIRYQQNLAGRRIALVVLGSNIWPVVREHAARIEAEVDRAEPGSFAFIEMPRLRGSRRNYR